MKLPRAQTYWCFSSFRSQCSARSLLLNPCIKQRLHHNCSKTSRPLANGAPNRGSIAWQRGLRTATQLFNRLHQAQVKRPLTVQLCTSTIIYLCGDLIAQKIGNEKYDSKRTLRMVIIGMIASTPGYKWWKSTYLNENNLLTNLLQVHLPRKPFQLRF